MRIHILSDLHQEFGEHNVLGTDLTCDGMNRLCFVSSFPTTDPTADCF